MRERILDLDRPTRRRPQPAPPVPSPPVPAAGVALDWRHRAACKGTVTGSADDVFYGPGWGDPHSDLEAFEREQQAKRLCAGCPVRRVCLDVALTTLEPHGVWGGMTEDERRDLLARTGTRLAKWTARPDLDQTRR